MQKDLTNLKNCTGQESPGKLVRIKRGTTVHTSVNSTFDSHAVFCSFFILFGSGALLLVFILAALCNNDLYGTGMVPLTHRLWIRLKCDVSDVKITKPQYIGLLHWCLKWCPTLILYLANIGACFCHNFWGVGSFHSKVSQLVCGLISVLRQSDVFPSVSGA